MKVFISWSGPTSKQVAEALRDWLPQVIQAVKPWLSSADMEKGTRWFPEISDQLKDTEVGIICLTRDNLASPWIHFEAGAVAKVVERSRVCPYLFGITPTDVQGPLTQFQATRAEKEDTRSLLTTINKALGEGALEGGRLTDAFDAWWSKLHERLGKVAAPAGQAGAGRSDHELLQEVVEVVRQLARQSSQVQASLEQPAFHRLLYPNALAAGSPLLAGLDNPLLSFTKRTPSFRDVLLKFAQEEAARSQEGQPAEVKEAQSGQEREETKAKGKG